MAEAAPLGVIGGSGLYELPGLVDKRWVRVETAWGPPSDQILPGGLGGRVRIPQRAARRSAQ